MNFKLRHLVAATLTGSALMGFATQAMADSTFDLVQALVTKGVLTEEEAMPLLKGREADIQLADKKVKKAAKLTVSDVIDNATLYGDIRVRYEDRSGTGIATAASPDVKETRERARYKMTLGVKTESGDWYSDLAIAMGANGRSDNATFGQSATTGNIDNKDPVFIKRAMLGYKASDWLTLEAGRMNNPLYTTPMVWDADLSFEGLVEKINYKINFADLFFTAAQVEYQGDKKDFSAVTGAPSDSITTELFAFQGGGRYQLNDTTSAKAALTYTTFSHNTSNTKFSPQLGTDLNTKVTGTGAGVNDLSTIEIPAEMNFMPNSSIGVRLFGDYVINTKADDRAKNSGLAAASNGASGSDDSAWMLGMMVGSANDFKSFEANKMVKGDWSMRIWYQNVGVWSVDPNAVDSDFMDSRVNMKGTTFKAQYNFTDNAYTNFAYGHASRKNNTYGAAGAAQDLALNLKKFDLMQLDLTYKF